MTTHLVARLRELHRWLVARDDPRLLHPYQIAISDAADRIERLELRRAALIDALCEKPCPVDGRTTIGHCRDCGCTDGLLLGDVK